MATSISSFNKIKKIISEIKFEINSFQDKIASLATNSMVIYRNNNFYLEAKDEIKSNNIDFINLSREEKINLFNKERNSRIQEIKKQLNFLDFIFIGDEKKDNSNNHNYAKLKTIKEVLDTDEYNVKQGEIDEFFEKVLAKKSVDREELLDNLIDEVKKTKLENEDNKIDSTKDLIITHDFISKLKNEGKEISENFEIKEKEKSDQNLLEMDDDLWFKSSSIDTDVKRINPNSFLDLISKK